jgi:hypothetical protein
MLLLLQKELSVVLATRVEDVLNAAFDNGLPALVPPDSDVSAKL